MLSELRPPHTRVGAHLNAGELAAGASVVDEVEMIIAAPAADCAYGAVGLAAWQGREAPGAELFEVT